MLRLPPAIFVVVLVGYSLLIASTTAVLTIGAAAMVLCALGIVALSTPVVVAGCVLALGEYALALWLSPGPPRLAGAVLFGVALILLLETVDFARRVGHAAMGPGLVSSQIRYWGTAAALAGTAALVVIALATAASAVVRLPWSPAFAAGGAVAALVAVAVTLRHPRLRRAARYWITWSARTRIDCGIVRPKAFAVLRLITSSNLVGRSIGRSDGLLPLRSRST